MVKAIDNLRHKYDELLFSTFQEPGMAEEAVFLVKQTYKMVGYDEPEVEIVSSPDECLSKVIKNRHGVFLNNMPVEMNLFGHVKNMLCHYVQPPEIIVHQVYCNHFFNNFAMETILSENIRKRTKEWSRGLIKGLQWTWSSEYDLILIDYLWKDSCKIPNLSLLAKDFCAIYPLLGKCFLVKKPVQLSKKKNGEVDLDGGGQMVFQDGVTVKLSHDEEMKQAAMGRMWEFLCS